MSFVRAPPLAREVAPARRVRAHRAGGRKGGRLGIWLLALLALLALDKALTAVNAVRAKVANGVVRALASVVTLTIGCMPALVVAVRRVGRVRRR